MATTRFALGLVVVTTFAACSDSTGPNGLPGVQDIPWDLLDGRLALTVLSEDENPFSLVLLDARDMRVRALASVVSWSDIALAPDSNVVAYTSRTVSSGSLTASIRGVRLTDGVTDCGDGSAPCGDVLVSDFLAFVTDPAWSNDGRLAYLRTSREGGGARAYHVEGSAVHEEGEPVGQGPGWATISWAPDGTLVAYLTVNGSDGLYRVDPESKSLDLMLSEADHHTTEPSVSPDGSMIAYTRAAKYSDEPLEVWVAGVDGSDRRRLAAGSGPAWSPDGRAIAFEKESGGVYVVAAEGGSPVLVVPGAREPSWQP